MIGVGLEIYKILKGIDTTEETRQKFALKSSYILKTLFY